MGEKMEEMSQEERKDFISQQMDALQHELEKASANVHLWFVTYLHNVQAARTLHYSKVTCALCA